MNIVIDIDGVLAGTNACDIECAAFFKNKGAIITAIKTHYIFPGVIEFLKFLHEIKGVRVSFYSSGDEDRNKEFVRKLLEISLGQTKYDEIKCSISILSRNDLVKTEGDSREHYRLYGLHHGNKKKDLSKVLKEGETLENTILIDDDASYVSIGQAKNFLHAPVPRVLDYQLLASRIKEYELDGCRYLRCFFSCESTKKALKFVKRGEQIYISQSQGKFILNFLGKDDRLCSEPIDSEQNRELIEKLAFIDKKRIEAKEKGCLIQEKETVKLICDLVIRLGGRGKKICRGLNRIYFIAGLLFTVLEKAKTENLSISEALFNLQYTYKPNKANYKSNVRMLRKTDRLYHLGLEKLRKFNTDLQLIHPISYLEIAKLNLSEEERLKLKAFIDNESGDCLIM